MYPLTRTGEPCARRNRGEPEEIHPPIALPFVDERRQIPKMALVTKAFALEYRPALLPNDASITS
jgi:hypothetical protein